MYVETSKNYINFIEASVNFPAPLSLILPVLVGSFSCLQTLFLLQNVPKMPIGSYALRKLKKFQTEALSSRIGERKRRAPSLAVSPSASVGYSSWDSLCPPHSKPTHSWRRPFLPTRRMHHFVGCPVRANGSTREHAPKCLAWCATRFWKTWHHTQGDINCG